MTKQNHYIWNASAHSDARKHVLYSNCTHTHMHRRINTYSRKHTHTSKCSSTLQHHTLIAVISSGCRLILEEKCKLSPPKMKKRCHISRSNISPLAISSDFIIHYARDNLLLWMKCAWRLDGCQTHSMGKLEVWNYLDKHYSRLVYRIGKSSFLGRSGPEAPPLQTVHVWVLDQH